MPFALVEGERERELLLLAAVVIAAAAAAAVAARVRCGADGAGAVVRGVARGLGLIFTN